MENSKINNVDQIINQASLELSESQAILKKLLEEQGVVCHFVWSECQDIGTYYRRVECDPKGCTQKSISS